MFPVRRELGRLPGLVELFRQEGSYASHPWWQAGLIRVLAEAGQYDEATSRLEALIARPQALLAGFLRRYSLVLAAEAAEILGHGDAAARLLPWLTAELGSGECIIVGPNTFLGSLRRYIGLVELTLGRTDAAVHDLVAALDVHERMRAKGWAARTRYDLARALLARNGPGDHEQAAARADEARRAARTLDMPRLLEELAVLRSE
jgi:tetratricopeptide (TPR) repeat protein